MKKSPKVRGYSWHCASCDPTVSRLEKYFVLVFYALLLIYAVVGLIFRILIQIRGERGEKGLHYIMYNCETLGSEKESFIPAVIY